MLLCWWLVVGSGVVVKGEGEREKRRGEVVFFLCVKFFWRGIAGLSWWGWWGIVELELFFCGAKTLFGEQKYSFSHLR